PGADSSEGLLIVHPSEIEGAHLADEQWVELAERERHGRVLPGSSGVAGGDLTPKPRVAARESQAVSAFDSGGGTECEADRLVLRSSSTAPSSRNGGTCGAGRSACGARRPRRRPARVARRGVRRLVLVMIAIAERQAQAARNTALPNGKRSRNVETRADARHVAAADTDHSPVGEAARHRGAPALRGRGRGRSGGGARPRRCPGGVRYAVARRARPRPAPPLAPGPAGR